MTTKKRGPVIKTDWVVEVPVVGSFEFKEKEHAKEYINNLKARKLFYQTYERKWRVI